jgi:hypothetical protein
MKETNRIMNRSLPPSHRRAFASGLVVMAATIGITACGSSTKGTTAAASTTTVPTSTGGGGAGPGTGTSGGRTFPGASGSVAAISGSSMEVQNASSGQTTVRWTRTSTFTKTATVTRAAIAVGDCVTVTGTSSKSPIVASSVAISKPSSGTCTRTGLGGGGFGAGGFGGGGPGGTRRTTATTGGSGTPSGNGARRFGGFSFASGKVTSVTATTLVLSGFSSVNGSTPPAGSTTAQTTPSTATTTVNVGLTPSTTFTETEAAAASALAVGDCVTATGQADTTGAISARTIRITSTGGKTCTTFGGFGRGPGTAPGG